MVVYCDAYWSERKWDPRKYVNEVVHPGMCISQLGQNVDFGAGSSVGRAVKTRVYMIYKIEWKLAIIIQHVITMLLNTLPFILFCNVLDLGIQKYGLIK